MNIYTRHTACQILLTLTTESVLTSMHTCGTHEARLNSYLRPPYSHYCLCCSSSSIVHHPGISCAAWKVSPYDHRPHCVHIPLPSHRPPPQNGNIGPTINHVASQANSLANSTAMTTPAHSLGQRVTQSSGRAGVCVNVTHAMSVWHECNMHVFVYSYRRHSSNI